MKLQHRDFSSLAVLFHFKKTQHLEWDIMWEIGQERPAFSSHDGRSERFVGLILSDCVFFLLLLFLPL